MSETTANTVEIPQDARLFFDRLIQITNPANEIASKIREAKSGDKERISNLLNSHEEFAEYRADMDKLQAALANISARIADLESFGKSKAQELLPELQEVNVEELQAELMPMRKTINATKNAIVGMFGQEVFDALAETTQYQELIGVGANSTTSVGSGNAKPRFSEITLSDGSGSPVSLTPSTIGELAKKTGIQHEDIFTAMKTAAGTDNLKDRAGVVIRFSLTGENKTYAIEATPK